MENGKRYATEDEDQHNPLFMMEENQVEPPEVGKPAVIYGFRNPEDGEIVYIYWRNWEARRKTLDPIHEMMDMMLDSYYEQNQIDQLNDLYKRS